MTVNEAARLLEVKPATVYALCRARKLGHQRIGVGQGTIRITQADLDAYVMSRRVEARTDEERAAPPCRPRVAPHGKLKYIR